MANLTLDNGPDIFAGNRFNSNILELNINSALHFIETYGILLEDVVANSMGMYNISKDVKEGKVKFLQSKGDRWFTKTKPASCAWDPAGFVTYSKSEVTLAPHNIQLAHCTEDVPGWEGLFGQGNESLLDTPVGQRFFQDMVKWIFRGIGNDLTASATWGNHPIIAAAKLKYSGDPDKFLRIQKTLNICGGWLTMVDAYKTQGLANYNVPISPTDVNGDEFIGDPNALFNKVRAAQTTEFKAATRELRAMGQRPILAVTPSIFEAYQNWLGTQYPTIPDMFYYKLNGEFCANLGCAGGSSASGVIGWGDFWVKSMDSWGVVSSDMEIYHHRVLATMPGNLGLGLDVKEDSNFNGMGLILQQKLDVDQAGKIVGATNYRMGTAILDKDFIVNASLVATKP